MDLSVISENDPIYKNHMTQKTNKNFAHVLSENLNINNFCQIALHRGMIVNKEILL
jgi:hypothetical protein